jgi:hypothetical protein
MAYSPVPTRTDADDVSSADVNQLQANITDGRGKAFVDSLDTTIGYLEDKLVAGTNITITESPTTSGDKTLTIASTGGGVTASEPDPTYAAGSFDFPASDPAPLDTDSGTGTIKRHLFDDTTQEYVIGQFVVPSDIDASGTVTFEAYGYAVTAAASKNIELTFDHCSKADGETWDDSFTSEVSGDLAVEATQDFLSRHTWTETVANLGWAANDQCRFKLSRTAPSANNLSGDYGLTHFRVLIPRA